MFKILKIFDAVLIIYRILFDALLMDELKQTLSKIIETLSSDDYPEIHNSLTYYIENDETDENLYDMATDIFNADQTKVLPQNVSDFVISIYEKMIAEGSHDAACDLGSLYYKGRFGKVDYKKAVHYYAIAADRGSRQAPIHIPKERVAEHMIFLCLNLCNSSLDTFVFLFVFFHFWQHKQYCKGRHKASVFANKKHQFFQKTFNFHIQIIYLRMKINHSQGYQNLIRINKEKGIFILGKKIFCEN